MTTTQQHDHRDSRVLRVAADDLRLHAERIEHNKCRWVPGTPQDVPEVCMLYTAGASAIRRVCNADAYPYVLHAIWRVVWEADGGLVDPTVAATMPAHEVENLIVAWNDRQPSARTVCRVLRSAADLLDQWADDADTQAGVTPAIDDRQYGGPDMTRVVTEDGSGSGGSAPPALPRTNALNADSWADEVRIASDPLTESDELSRLAKGHVWARWAVASNTACPVQLLRELAGDEAPLVRRAVRSNPSSPTDVLDFLALDSDERVSG